MKTTKRIKYSIIIPAYNSQEVIGICLNAIKKIKKHRKDFEVIVVDDKSADRSVQLARNYFSNVIELKENVGPGAARNAGAKQAKGEILVFIDADVEVSEDVLEKFDRKFQESKDPKLAGIMGVCSPTPAFNDTPSRIYNYFFHAIHASSPEKIQYPNTSLVAIKRSAFDEVGGFHPTLRICEDNELGIRLSEKGHYFLIDKKLQFIHHKKMGWMSAVKTPFFNSVNRAKFRLSNEKIGKGVKANTLYFYVNGFLTSIGILLFIFTPITTPIPLMLIILAFLLYNRFFFQTIIENKSKLVFFLKSFLYLYSYFFFAAIGGGYAIIKRKTFSDIHQVIEIPKLFTLGYYRKYTSKQPVTLTYFVTALCNARCQMCFYWKNIEQSSKAKELELSEVRQFAKSMEPFPILMLSGGEPFLRKDLPELVEAFYRHCNISTVSIPTNAIQTKQIIESVEKILWLCPDLELRISLSIDGIGKPHDKIRGVKNAFESLMKTKEGLEKIRKENYNLKIFSAFTLSSYNQQELDKYVDFVISENCFDDAVIVLARGDTREEKAKDIDIKSYLEAVNRLTNHFIKGGIVKRIMSTHRQESKQSIASIYQDGSGVVPCMGGTLNAVVTEEGTVYPCEMLKKPLGNLKNEKYDFKAIWNNSKTKEVRQWIKKTKCTCTHECNIPFNIMFNINPLFSVMKKVIRK